MSEGFFKVYRSLLDNPIWTLEPFSKGQAWVDLLMIANYTEGEINVRGNIIIIQRGQVGWSELGLSKRWKWSRSKVRAFIKYLEKRHQIEQHKNTISSIISITNYEYYQEKDSKKDSTETAEEQQKDTKKKDKKKKKVKKEEYSFEEFWDAFGYKDGKKPALAAWNRIKMDDLTFKAILSSAAKEATRRPALRQKNATPKMAQGWLTEERWNDSIYAEMNGGSPGDLEERYQAAAMKFYNMGEEPAQTTPQRVHEIYWEKVNA